MIKVCEVRKSRAVNAIKTIEHPPARSGDTEVNMADISGKPPHRPKRFTGQPCGISSSRSRNTVDIRSFSVIPKDADLILHTAALQKLRMQHDTALSRRSQNIGRT